MEKPEIISYLKENGTWIRLEEMEPERAAGLAEQVLKKAAAAIGFEGRTDYDGKNDSFIV
ncbi:hypothetical protein [Marvinbryantia formatexigens]|uniref:hypothetical protein n=1 Tax=Marvinbryantia formatexigens TaxID=168384 RepID=UPI0003004D35|nr:hypothetical protein [Marvinbryantia formatexigens]UWO25378.1 hypothetical protein NQ534_02475 [Marvinbryantia formatexigens DSM 14469]